MTVPITNVIKEAGDFIHETAKQNRYGDITVTITMNDGIPVKITKVFCEHLAKRITAKVVEK